MIDAEEIRVPLGKVEKEWWFPTPIWFLDIPAAAALNERLLRAIDELRAADQAGVVRSNALGWHSQVDLQHQSAFASLMTAALEIARACHRDWRVAPTLEPYVDNCWANVSPRYAYNRMHTHPGVWLSGVYYVRTPANCGRIVFSDPRPQVHAVNVAVETTGPDTWRTVHYDAIAGRIVLFPSWLPHEVEQNMSDDGDRVSVAFNVGLRRAADA